MATKQELELKVMDLERDVQRLIETLSEIYGVVTNADYSSSPTLEQTPAYIIGRVQGIVKFVPVNLSTIRFSDYLDTLRKATA